MIPENDVFFPGFLEATHKDQAHKHPKERVDRVDRVDRVVWNVQKDQLETERWEGGEKLLMGMIGVASEDDEESVECSEDGEADSGIVSVCANKHA